MGMNHDIRNETLECVPSWIKESHPMLCHQRDT